MTFVLLLLALLGAFLKASVASTCPDYTVHWLQPQLQKFEDPNTQQIVAALDPSQSAEINAWCFPTAAASLFGHYALKHDWDADFPLSFDVKVVGQLGGAYVYSVDGVSQKPLVLTRGTTYIFSLSNLDYDDHPFAFRELGGTEYTDGINMQVFYNNQIITFAVPLDAPDNLEYYCTNHPLSMGSNIAVVDRFPNSPYLYRPSKPYSHTVPWGDFMWHDINKWNLGDYMNTKKDIGTTLEEGTEGMRQFMTDIYPDVDVTIETVPGYPDVSSVYPLLLHIKAGCVAAIPNNLNGGEIDEWHIKLAESNPGAPENIAQSQLGHTVVAWKYNNELDIQLSHGYDVSMNLPTPINLNGLQCSPTPIKLVNASCITSFTTVQFGSLSDSSEDDDDMTFLIVGAVAGGVVLLGFILYVTRARMLGSKVGMSTIRVGDLIF